MPQERNTAVAAGHRIQGYYLPAPHELHIKGGKERAFERAKRHCIEALERGLQATRAHEYEDFTSIYGPRHPESSGGTGHEH